VSNKKAKLPLSKTHPKLAKEAPVKSIKELMRLTEDFEEQKK
jgi:hypothetical protein